MEMVVLFVHLFFFVFSKCSFKKLWVYHVFPSLFFFIVCVEG